MSVRRNADSVTGKMLSIESMESKLSDVNWRAMQRIYKYPFVFASALHSQKKTCRNSTEEGKTAGG